MLMKYMSLVAAVLLMQLANACEDNANYGLKVDNPGASCPDIYEKNQVWIISYQN